MAQQEQRLVSELEQLTLSECTDAKEANESQVHAFIKEYDAYHATHGIAQPFTTPIQSSDMREICADAWDADFINRIWDENKQNVYRVAGLTRKSGNKALMLLCAAKIASVIRLQPIDRLRKLLS